jgi:hypothetical protein
VAVGDTTSASSLGAFSWTMLLATWPTRRSKVVHLGDGLQWLVDTAVARGRASMMVWCGVGEENGDHSTRWCTPFIAARRGGTLAAALSVARGAASEAVSTAMWRQLSGWDRRHAWLYRHRHGQNF